MRSKNEDILTLVEILIQKLWIYHTNPPLECVGRNGYALEDLGDQPAQPAIRVFLNLRQLAGRRVRKRVTQVFADDIATISGYIVSKYENAPTEAIKNRQGQTRYQAHQHSVVFLVLSGLSARQISRIPPQCNAGALPCVGSQLEWASNFRQQGQDHWLSRVTKDRAAAP